MPKNTKYAWRGEVVDAVELEHTTKTESKLEVALEDGTTLTYTITPQKILRLSSAYNDAGEPIYIMQTNTSLTASVPAELIRAPEEKKS